MLSYWIVRDRNERPIGLARCEGDRVFLKLNAPLDANWFLLSNDAAVCIRPSEDAVLCGAFAVLGMREDRPVAFAAAPAAPSLARCRAVLSRFYTMQADPAPQPDPIEEAPEPNVPEAEPNESEAEPDEPARVQIEPEAPQAPDSPDVLTVEPSEDAMPETADESAQRAAQFSLLLSRAESFYSRFEQPPAVPVDNLVQKEDNSPCADAVGIDLFPQAFPRAHWRYVDGADILPHYEGLWIAPNGAKTRILAVRGHAAPRPPRALYDFTRFLRGADGSGYWIKTE